MDPTVLFEKFSTIYRDSPHAIYALGGVLIALVLFKRKYFFRVLLLLLFITGVYLVIDQFGQSLDTGIKNKEEMSTKTRKALE